MPSNARASLPVLPPELWLHIHRLAIGDLSPFFKIHELNNAVSMSHHYDPLNDRHLQRFLKAARSLGRVCRLWHQLAQELLYENVWINTRRWPSLSAALEKPAIAHRVRSVLLSTTRFDYNAAMLQHAGVSETLEVLLQPEFPRAEALYAAEKGIQLPPLTALKRIVWVESWWSAGLLQDVLAAAAPAIQHITLSTSFTIGSEPNSIRVPDLPRLETLSVARLSSQHVSAFLSTGLRGLKHLTINPMHLTVLEFPALASVTTLTLIEYPSPIYVPFPTLCTHFPALRELQYDARAVPIPPQDKQTFPELLCVRLYLPVASHVATHLPLFRQPAFGALERVVLDGQGWEYLATVGSGEWMELEVLREKGCRIEGVDGREYGRPET
ncbi:hypothetical protein C8F01DRAFT_377305 [Mycena amicta]|nr:hypothetical protein C8F01DRAFT_377305 [Mycena amicta]